MTDRDNGDFTDHEAHELPEGPGVAFRPIERVIDSNGEEKIIAEAIPLASDEAEARWAMQNFMEYTGFKPLSETERTSHHAFSSNRWRSPWNPPGPRPNWQIPPKNPSLN